MDDRRRQQLDVEQARLTATLAAAGHDVRDPEFARHLHLVAAIRSDERELAQLRAAGHDPDAVSFSSNPVELMQLPNPHQHTWPQLATCMECLHASFLRASIDASYDALDAITEAVLRERREEAAAAVPDVQQESLRARLHAQQLQPRTAASPFLPAGEAARPVAR